jgi:WD repeat-containing protein 48
MYADELELEEKIEFRDDQRSTTLPIHNLLWLWTDRNAVNLGKWILRYLFSNLIDEEIKRDETFRNSLLKAKTNSKNRSLPPMNIQIPDAPMNGWRDAVSGPASTSTIRASNGFHYPATPGMAIGLATPGMPPSSAGHGSQRNPMTPAAEELSQLEKTQTQQSQAKENNDYFSKIPTNNGTGNTATSTEGSSDAGADTLPQTPSEDTPATKKKALFSKKFNMSFNMKKFGTASASAETAKPAAVDEKA